MYAGLYSVAAGGLAAVARLEATSQNLANVNTVGYKANRPIFGLRTPPATSVAAIGRTPAQPVEVGTVVDLSPGSVHSTGNALDVALSGPEFFVVQTRAGERYTRQGSFQLDHEGYLVTGRGERVQGTSGDLRAEGTDVQISGNGTVFVDGAPSGSLRLVRFANPSALLPEGSALLHAAPGAAPTPVDANDVHVEPGALEGANVDPVRSLLELVNVARGYETYTAAIRALEQVSGKSINEVGRVP